MNVLPLIVGLISIFVFATTWTVLVGGPWMPTRNHQVKTMLKLADVGEDDTVYDLGCGDGRVLISAARDYGAKAVGIEFSLLLYLVSKLRIFLLGLGDRVTVKHGNIFNAELSGATVVTCYLLQGTTDRIVTKLVSECVPGTRIVSNNFPMTKMEPVQQTGRIFLYRIAS